MKRDIERDLIAMTRIHNRPSLRRPRHTRIVVAIVTLSIAGYFAIGLLGILTGA